MELYYAVVRNVNSEIVIVQGTLEGAQFCAGRFPFNDPASIVAYERNGSTWTLQADGSTPSDEIIAALEVGRIGYQTMLGSSWIGVWPFSRAGAGRPWTDAMNAAEAEQS